MATSYTFVPSCFLITLCGPLHLSSNFDAVPFAFEPRASCFTHTQSPGRNSWNRACLLCRSIPFSWRVRMSSARCSAISSWTRLNSRAYHTKALSSSSVGARVASYPFAVSHSLSICTKLKSSTLPNMISAGETIIFARLRLLNQCSTNVQYRSQLFLSGKISSFVRILRRCPKVECFRSTKFALGLYADKTAIFTFINFPSSFIRALLNSDPPSHTITRGFRDISRQTVL